MWYNKNKMGIGSKIIGRITKTTAGSTHTANAIRAHTNGGYSSRNMENARPMVAAGDRTVAKYESSIIGQSRYKREKASDKDQAGAARTDTEQGRFAYDRMSRTALGSRLDDGRRSERGRALSRASADERRFGASRISRDATAGASGNRFNRSSHASGAANATARPAPKPTFRRPM